MIEVTVNLLATFRTDRFKDEVQQVSEGTTVGSLVSALGILEKEVGMALVNGRHAPMAHPLSHGDVLHLAPWIAGG
jgi:molybdopterin converting factor small subunit